MGARKYVLHTFAATQSALMKKRVSRIMLGSPCSLCGGRRLKREALAIKFAGVDIGTLSALPLNRVAELLAPAAAGHFTEPESPERAAPRRPQARAAQRGAAHQGAPDVRRMLNLSQEKRIAAQRIAQELVARITTLQELGLGYLSIDCRSPKITSKDLRRATGSSMSGRELGNKAVTSCLRSAAEGVRSRGQPHLPLFTPAVRLRSSRPGYLDRGVTLYHRRDFSLPGLSCYGSPSLRRRHALLALFLTLVMSCQDGPLDVGLPPLMLWAWERPEDLRFLSTLPGPPIGVAYLHATVFLLGERVQVRRRVGGLQVPAGAPLLPVIRIEAERAPLPTLDAQQRLVLRQVLLAEVRRAGQGRLQLDFEALVSQRRFYRQLLAELRADLGPRFVLSMTALTSWCLGDRWLQQLPVDEIVPMFYRLGRAAPGLRAELRSGRDLLPECRRAHGLITDEPMTPPPTPRRLYLFAPTAWSASSLHRALADLAAAGSHHEPSADD